MLETTAALWAGGWWLTGWGGYTRLPLGWRESPARILMQQHVHTRMQQRAVTLPPSCRISLDCVVGATAGADSLHAIATPYHYSWTYLAYTAMPGQGVHLHCLNQQPHSPRPR